MVTHRDTVLRCSAALRLAVPLLLLLLLLSSSSALARRREIDYDALEKAWAADDDPQELQSEADKQFERLSTVSQEEAKAIGPQMVFVVLDTNEPLSELASRWKEMLWNGGVEVNIYEIETSKVLIGLQKGRNILELRAFLKQQREVVTYDWNSKMYSRDDTIEDGTGAARKVQKETKKRSKSKNKKAKMELSTIEEL